MKTMIGKVLLMSATSLMLLQACSKDDKPDTTPDTNDNERSLAAVKASSDVFFDDLSQEVLTVNTENELTRVADVQACASITVTPAANVNEWPKTVTVDYGTDGCTGANGFVRKGKVTYVISKMLRETGATIVISFDNYTVNDHKLEGTYTIRNNGSLMGLNITTVLENGKITYPDGKWYTKASNVTWVHEIFELLPAHIPLFVTKL